ncbi:TPA: hypothetical protein JBL19_04180 [Legionella pneumophila]|nr:hypothetical protein [Legionella pneumophila]MDW8880642.1 hypothetical protein [Legionella pneumophila subsp. fraseri]MDW8962258.1 hypothetical protein [Legionella pneumophila subsp. fraseri]MDW9034748.1 hypothetical protein [Legionella pneumophila subsp. fraseri]MDW9037576.1 hypothetical protein [Legionella pneumophila subsp. fraseri]MDW9040869.1 hypothetical protein [Legionella pneumophila subsp. fraseri]
MKNLILIVCLVTNNLAIADGTIFNSDGSSSSIYSDDNGDATIFNSDGSSSSVYSDGKGGATIFNSDGSSSTFLSED